MVLELVVEDRDKLTLAKHGVRLDNMDSSIEKLDATITQVHSELSKGVAKLERKLTILIGVLIGSNVIVEPITKFLLQ